MVGYIGNPFHDILFQRFAFKIKFASTQFQVFITNARARIFNNSSKTIIAFVLNFLYLSMKSEFNERTKPM